MKKILKTVMLMFIVACSMGAKDYVYTIGNATVSYVIPSELDAALTYSRGMFTSFDKRIVYKTSFMKRGFFTEKPIGGFAIGILAMPDELRNNHSLESLLKYYEPRISNDLEVARGSVYATQNGEWVKMEVYLKADTAKIVQLLFYRVIDGDSVLSLSLHVSGKGEQWPPKLFKKLDAAVHKVVNSISIKQRQE